MPLGHGEESNEFSFVQDMTPNIFGGMWLDCHFANYLA